jgi:crossover junction endodeoxyribonuclease RuvC
VNYLGYDPGKEGGFGLIDEHGSLIECIRMPKHESEIVNYLMNVAGRYHPVTVIMEKAQAMPKQGITSTANYVGAYQFVRGIVVTLGLRYQEVRPSEWKKVVLAGEGDKKSKDTSIRVCERLFPNVDLTPGKCTKPQDGMAEALLIAEYGRRKGI